MQHRQDRTARALVISLLLCWGSPSTAQRIHEPASVMTRLYCDCVNADLMSAQIEPTRIGIHEYIETVDDRCLEWAIVWYTPLMGHQPIALPESVITRIGLNRVLFLRELRGKLLKDAMIR